MLELRKFVAPEFIFGLGALDLVGRYAGNFGARKAFIVTDEGVVNSGITQQVIDNLKAIGLEFSLFTAISPNPRAQEVMAGAEQYLSDSCDVIISVGGGSPMDCAKGIGIVTTNRRHILEFEGIDNVEIPGPPLICLPTTAGTAADVSQFAIISNREELIKIAIVSKTMVPDVALIDPAATVSMDGYLTACTGIDALVHAFEAYVSTAHAPILDLHALNAITLIFENLVPVLQEPGNMELRGRIALASLEAGLAFSNASLGAVHAMAHSCGGLLDMPHGECNALLLDHVVAYNYPKAPERYRNIARAIGVPVDSMDSPAIKNEILQRIRQLKQEVGIIGGLKERGTVSADIPALARNAMKDPCMVTNPRVAAVRDIEVIYEEAL
ncbi:alcohol dehydrogenase-like regulatory protein ErcA [Desulfopila inferna]|uniref:alcohol dehydrogenase-like regulatory protein ErcA n=1 Tax=Desulfopila inferna TaxID=468528 RepID=UPI001962CB33|nr:alcohol dehydrogenase-like regulatory protein ErcA [Desulfopila inferna]MBM9604562.1 iron-containing alcohol dehydrogenase [Desulfopila inferna]